MNHGTEAKMVARRLRLLNSDQNEALLRGLCSPDVSGRTRITWVGYTGVTVEQTGDRYFSLLVLAANEQASWGFQQ